ncbi:MAG TPA: glycosyltransferase family 87 protein [Allosphingosinicella sp.]|jgi:hypothetical protein|uniref:glycosyltransferase family 87 protein n=1 Tax=Allosphingosinicella sp. TaxID=2823234 RepID=UPI002F29CB7F
MMRLQALDAQVTALLAYARANRLVALGWIAALYLAMIFLGIDWSTALRNSDLSVAPSTVLGRDFANVFTGGHLILDGRLSAIYDLQAYQAYQVSLFDGAVSGHNYSYGPVSFLYVWLFGLLPYFLAYLLWTGLTGAAFLVAARPYLREAGLPAWLALLAPAALMNVWAGHYGFLIGALWLGAWHLLDSRPRTAGLLIGLMIVKPHLAILMPLLLIRRRAWTAFATAALTVAGLVALSLLLFGVQPWVNYLTKTIGLQAAMVDDVNQFFVSMMPTVAPPLFLAGLPAAIVWPVQIIAAIAAAAALLFFMPADPRRAGLAAACATFLVLPYAFTYDMTAVSIASLVLLQRARPDAGWALSPIGAVLAFVVPVATVALNQKGIPLAPLMIAYMLAALLAPAQVRQPVRTASA